MDSVVEHRSPIVPTRSRGASWLLGRGITASVVLHGVAVSLAILTVHVLPPPQTKEEVLELVLTAPAKPALPAPSLVTAPEPETVPSAQPAIVPPPTDAPAPPPLPPVARATQPPEVTAQPQPQTTTAVEPAAATPPVVPTPTPTPMPEAPLRAAQAAPALPVPPRKVAPHLSRPVATETRVSPAPPVLRPSGETQMAPTRQNETAAASPPSAPAPPVQTAQSSPTWLASVSGWLMAHRSYPDLARRRGQEGTVVLRFTVDRDGQVQDVNLVRSSGSDELDRAALALLANAHLPPFPPEMAFARQTMTVPIRYRLE